MAEEEKVIVAEVSNEALNQLKKAFEPTAVLLLPLVAASIA